MDSVFQEESDTLREAEKKIRAAQNQHYTQVQQIAKEVAEFKCMDAGDRRELADLNDRMCRHREKSAFYDSVIPQPYFGRMDLEDITHPEDDDGEPFHDLCVYIGKRAIEVDGDYLAVDWRDPLGNYYYVKTEKEFTVKEYKYRLALRRSLEIQDAKLIRYNTEFDGESVSLQGDVIDPFLLKVLKDKRRQNRLTDIIQSIQGNQNEIIRKPRKDSFVLQGCAGSGKTMILLHRISYLKFNNRDMDLGAVKIITPNQFFNTHINELSEELGLHEIERYSVEGYYAHLINTYSPKISIQTDVVSEASLPIALLREIYSIEYLQENISQYEAYWQEIVAALEANHLAALLQQCGKTMPDMSSKSSDVSLALERALNEICNEQKQNQSELRTLDGRIHTLENMCAEAAADKAATAKTLSDARKAAIDNLGAEQARLSQQLAEGQATVRRLQAQKELCTPTSELLDKAHSAEQELARLRKDKATLLQYDLVLTHANPLAKTILAANQVAVDTIVHAQDQYNKIPFYNFGRKAEMRNVQKNAQELFAVNAQTIIEEREQSLEKEVQELQAQSKQLEAQQEIIAKETKELLAEMSKLLREKDQIEPVAEALKQGKNPVLKNSLPAAVYMNCRVTAELLAQAYEKAENAAHKVDILQETLHTRQQERVALQQQCLPAQLRDESLKQCVILTEQLHFDKILSNVQLRKLMAAYEAVGQPYKAYNYRYRLYLGVLFCALYYGNFKQCDKLLCIDEAQDISAAEYSVLRKALGESCAFNLYGDINQRLTPYHGVEDWAEIRDAITNELFVLNENYRNTMQITEFCNKEFSAEVYAIGISGPEVQELDLAEAIAALCDRKAKQPTLRCAVLWAGRSRATRDKLAELLQDQTVVWDDINDEKLSVAPIEFAKGLEFDAVAVIEDGMTFNEKYVAYTRALDNLFVVRGVQATMEVAVPAAVVPVAKVAAPMQESTPTPSLALPEPEAVPAPDETPQPEKTIPNDFTQEEAFGRWLATKRNLARRTVVSYQGGLRRCETLARTNHLIDKSLYDIETYDEVCALAERIAALPKFVTLNATGHSMYSASLNNYCVYRQENAKATKAIPVPVGPAIAAHPAVTAHSTEKEMPTIVTTDLSIERDYAFAQPISITYANQETLVANWKDLYTNGCSLLYAEYPHVFENIASHTITWLGGVKIATQADMLGAPRQMAPGIFVETRLSATDLMHRLRGLMELCNAEFEKLEITYAKLEAKEKAVAPKQQKQPDVLSRNAAAYPDDMPLATALKAPLFVPLVAHLAQEDITTLGELRKQSNIISYINHRELYALRERIAVWEALKPILRPAEAVARQAPAVPPPEALPIIPSPPPISRSLAAEVTAYVEKQGLAPCRVQDVAAALNSRAPTVRTILEAEPGLVEIGQDAFIHENAIVDLDDAAEKLEEILQSQFQRFCGYTNAETLFAAARVDLFLFMNDNGFDTENEIYRIAAYLFGKKHVHGLQYSFYNNQHIWPAEPDFPKSMFGVMINYACHSDTPLKRTEIENYITLLGGTASTYRQIMKIGTKGDFLQYIDDDVILAEKIPVTPAWCDQVAAALAKLFTQEGADVIILRAIPVKWLTANLPLLPNSLDWTALLLQDVIDLYLQDRYRTIRQSEGLQLNTIRAAIVMRDSPVQSFADVVHTYWLADEDRQTAYTCESLRQYLCDAKMLQGQELRYTLPRALDDYRFSWDTAKENVKIIRG